MEVTEDMKRMARRIAAHALCGPEKWKPGVKAGMYESIMRGDADTEALVLGPLAAIMETAEACANLAEECWRPSYVKFDDGEWTPGSPYDRGAVDNATRIATAIRAGEHYALAGAERNG